MSPRSALIRSQGTGQVCMASLDIETKWEWKLRNYSVKLKFSTTRRGMVGKLKKYSVKLKCSAARSSCPSMRP